MLQVCKRVGILLVEVFKRVGKYVISVCEKAHMTCILWLCKRVENILVLRFLHVKTTVNL